jgi:short-subunit dehydrogenase
MASEVVDEHGAPDVIVNNAGAGRWLFIEETEPSEFLDQVAAPFHAAFLVTRALIEPMLERGSGRVVTVNSPAAYAPWPGSIGYACSRWGLRGFSESLAVDLAGTGIGVTEVVAGHVDSAYFEVNAGTQERIPSLDRVMRRLAPADVATIICDAVAREKRRVITPVEWRLTLALSRLVPRLGSSLAVATGARRASTSVRTASPR